MYLSVPVYRTFNGSCPYLPERVWENLTFQVDQISAGDYETLLNQGFRRSGTSIYHPICHGCRECIPIRVNIQNFQLKKNHRRTLRKNQDIRIEHGPPLFCQPGFELYRKYLEGWHHSDEDPQPEEYHSFLIQSPVPSEMMYYYLQDKLVGIGFLDMLDRVISSVYFIFDPELTQRRLGVFSILKEIEYCHEQQKEWLYLGYYVHGCGKMDYKADYSPAEILTEERWKAYDRSLPDIK